MTKVTRNIYLSVFSVGFIAIFSIIQMHINLLSKRTERIVEALKEQDKAITELERAVSLIQYNGRTNKPEAKKTRKLCDWYKTEYNKKSYEPIIHAFTSFEKGFDCKLYFDDIEDLRVITLDQLEGEYNKANCNGCLDQFYKDL